MKNAGKYRLGMQLTKAPDYGIVQLYLDGQKLGRPVDLYREGGKADRPAGHGRARPDRRRPQADSGDRRGERAAIKAYMFGLDYVKLTGVDRLNPRCIVDADLADLRLRSYEISSPPARLAFVSATLSPPCIECGYGGGMVGERRRASV